MLLNSLQKASKYRKNASAHANLWDFACGKIVKTAVNLY